MWQIFFLLINITAAHLRKRERQRDILGRHLHAIFLVTEVQKQ